MPYRTTPFITEGFYHSFNRGVEKRDIFTTDRDYQRFFETLYYYQHDGPKPRFSTHDRFKIKDFDKNPKIVEVICYCLMPNHFHLLLKQLKEGGVQEFLSKVTNSYTKYFNTKHNRVGHLFQGQFKAVLIDTDEQLVHVSRYIHLNPCVANLVKDLEEYDYCSFSEYTKESIVSFCNTAPILSRFKDKDDYREFVTDHTSYALDVHRIKHLILEDH